MSFIYLLFLFICSFVFFSNIHSFINFFMYLSLCIIIIIIILGYGRWKQLVLA